MCLSWGCVWCAPYVTFVSNNVIRTNIITSDKPDILFILGNKTKGEIWDNFSFVIGWLYLLGMNVSTVAESSKKTRFIASTARPWLHSFRWRRGSGEATSWPAVRPPNGRGGPRCGCLKASSSHASRSQIRQMAKCVQNGLMNL